MVDMMNLDPVYIPDPWGNRQSVADGLRNEAMMLANNGIDESLYSQVNHSEFAEHRSVRQVKMSILSSLFSDDIFGWRY